MAQLLNMTKGFINTSKAQFSNFMNAYVECINLAPRNKLIRFDELAIRVLKRLNITPTFNVNLWSEQDLCILAITEYAELIDHFSAEIQYL